MCELLKINIMRQMFDGQVAHLTSIYENISILQKSIKILNILLSYNNTQNGKVSQKYIHSENI